MFLHDTSEESHAININQQLVMEGYAINAEEPYQSRVCTYICIYVYQSSVCMYVYILYIQCHLDNPPTSPIRL